MRTMSACCLTVSLKSVASVMGGGCFGGIVGQRAAKGNIAGEECCGEAVEYLKYQLAREENPPCHAERRVPGRFRPDSRSRSIPTHCTFCWSLAGSHRGGVRGAVGILRLRVSCALRRTRCARNDRGLLAVRLKTTASSRCGMGKARSSSAPGFFSRRRAGSVDKSGKSAPCHAERRVPGRLRPGSRSRSIPTHCS